MWSALTTVLPPQPHAWHYGHEPPGRLLSFHLATLGLFEKDKKWKEKELCHCRRMIYGALFIWRHFFLFLNCLCVWWHLSVCVWAAACMWRSEENVKCLINPSDPPVSASQMARVLGVRAWLFTEVLGIWNQLLRLAQRARLTHWAVSAALKACFQLHCGV